MKFKYLSILLAVLFVCGINFAQTYEKTDSGVKSIINSIEVEIQFYTSSIVRVLKSQEGTDIKKNSLSVNKAPQKIAFTIRETGDILYLKSESLQVSLNLKSGKISYSTPKGEPLLSEKEEGTSFTDFND
ncbi:MAG TPA: xylosidase, partial [Ignavibacteriales bacterium]|nr:xylosidase [Ignavibacteriales bacterium]